MPWEPHTSWWQQMSGDRGETGHRDAVEMRALEYPSMTRAKSRESPANCRGWLTG